MGHTNFRRHMHFAKWIAQVGGCFNLAEFGCCQVFERESSNVTLPTIAIVGFGENLTQPIGVLF